ncbi:MAG: hypothetical protein ACOVP2_06480, partial [Armatimonadaceae bacterium]
MISIRRRAILLVFPAVAISLFTACSKPETGGTAGGNATATPSKLVFGFVPSVEADKIAENAQPMADFLTKELGIPVETSTT